MSQNEPPKDFDVIEFRYRFLATATGTREGIVRMLRNVADLVDAGAVTGSVKSAEFDLIDHEKIPPIRNVDVIRAAGEGWLSGADGSDPEPWSSSASEAEGEMGGRL